MKTVAQLLTERQALGEQYAAAAREMWDKFRQVYVIEVALENRNLQGVPVIRSFRNTANGAPPLPSAPMHSEFLNEFIGAGREAWAWNEIDRERKALFAELGL